jgi:hypothetical protein
MEVWLPHESGDWSSMGFASTTTPDAPVLVVDQSGTAQRQYRVTKRDIIQAPIAHEESSVNAAMEFDQHLRSGEKCRLEQSRDSQAFVNAVDARGHARSLVSKSDFLATTHNIVQLSDPDNTYCTHFQDIDLLIVGYDTNQVTLVVAPGKLWLASPAAPFAITPHHLVLHSDLLQDGAPSGSWDYVNVTRKRSP